MPTVIKIILFTGLSLFMTSCRFDIDGDGIFFDERISGNGNVLSKEIQVNGPFDQIRTSSGWEVVLKPSETSKITAETDENLFEALEVFVRNNTLYVGTRDGYNIGRSNSRVVYVDYSGALSKLRASSGSRISSTEDVKSNSLELITSSGANIDVLVEARNVKAKASSGSSLKIAGLCEEVHTDGSSGAIISARQLKSETASAEASSGSQISLWASEKLSNRASSGGTIYYYGEPSQVNTAKVVSGSVIKK